ncbi:hypothetical protein BC835DRAFT_1409649 [Cytidiella melzeri]|nr:hypothetical protein BC835DRAFT_1409649 [Cytidiella melzeri]
MERRAIDLTPTSRLQFVMAAADAIWRILVSPDSARKDTSSFMAFVTKLRPASSGKLTIMRRSVSNTNSLVMWGKCFVWMHGYEARRKPTLEAIDKEGTNLYQMKNRSAAQRDKQHENTMRTHHYLLLYEELAITMFPPWIQIFRAVGKHKYANRMLLFMHQLYNVYPVGLRRAVRYNMLVNPTGRAHHFRAVDWVVELLNLFIKEMYGGEGSNYTTNRILDESALVLIYRNCHRVFEQNFLLSGLSYAHGTKNMTATFNDVQQYIQGLEESPNKYRAGREAKYEIPNALDRGAAIITAESAVMWGEIEKEGGRGVGDEDYWGLTDAVSARDLATEGAL